MVLLFSNCCANRDPSESLPSYSWFSASERATGNTWSMIFRTDWAAFYVIKIGAFQAEPVVELVCIGFSAAGLKLGTGY
jgi:hypothetical protein